MEEELSLLLCVIIDCNINTAIAGIDWEAVNSLCDDKIERFRERYPIEGNGVSKLKFPNSKCPSIVGMTEYYQWLIELKQYQRLALKFNANG